MGNYFVLNFDTTGPHITIAAPHYTIPGEQTEIYVIANEPLLNWQEIYYIDSRGRRYDFIFSHIPEQYMLKGIVDFNFCPLGIGVLYARVKDEVGNISELVTKPINVMAAALAYMKTADRAAYIQNTAHAQAIGTTENMLGINTAEMSRVVNLTEDCSLIAIADSKL